VPQDATASKSTARIVALAAAGLLLFAVFAAAPGSPFQPLLPEGAGPSGPLTWLAKLIRFDRLQGNWLVMIGVVVSVFAVAAFFLLVREAFHGRVSLRAVLLLAVGANVLVLLTPLLFSRDVFSYGFYGRIAGVYQANPYIHTPVEFGSDSLWPFVGPKWVDTPAVYGPLFTGLSGLIARVARTPGEQVMAYRAIAVAGSLAICGLIAVVARRVWPERAAVAVAMWGLNPIVLFHSVASGHNDILMALGILGGFALLIRGRELPAIAALSLAALVKATAVAPLAIAIVWCVARRPPGQRLRTLVTRVGLAALLAALAAAPFWQWDDPTLGMAELMSHTGWLAPSVLVGDVVDVISFGELGFLVRFCFSVVLLGAVVLLAREVWRRARDRDTQLELGAAMAWSLVLLMLLSPILLPWYVVWALPLAWLLPRPPRIALLVSGATLAMAQWLTEPLRYPQAFSINVYLGKAIATPLLLALAIWALVDLRRRLVSGSPLEDQQDVPESGRDGADDDGTPVVGQVQAEALRDEAGDR
jgi:alpha-1,6-mannosyltransferase